MTPSVSGLFFTLDSLLLALAFLFQLWTAILTLTLFQLFVIFAAILVFQVFTCMYTICLCNNTGLKFYMVTFIDLFLVSYFIIFNFIVFKKITLSTLFYSIALSACSFISSMWVPCW